MSARARAVFLDLQGTLGGDGLGDIRDFEFYSFAPHAVKLINQSSFLAIVITNQSRIGKGFLSFAEYEERLQHIQADLARHGARFGGVYCCPHTRSDGCECKKPLPGLIYRAAADFNIDVQRSYVIGDMGATDMVLAHAIGAKGVLVRTGVGEGSLGEYRSAWAGIEPAHVAENVLEGVRWVMNDSASGSGASSSRHLPPYIEADTVPGDRPVVQPALRRSSGPFRCDSVRHRVAGQVGVSGR